jgi:UDP-glucose 4-epimerase
MVLDAARKAGVRRVVYAASSSAYGGGSASAEETQKENQPLAARSPYAAAKLAGELYLQAFTSTYGLETARLRFFNIFGPRQRADSPYSGVIALFIDKIAKGLQPVVHGDGLQSRDFTYVANAVQALTLAATAPKAVGNVYNVGTGDSITVLDLVKALCDIFKQPYNHGFGPERAGDVKYSRADITNTKRDLGYDPKFTFQNGLAKTVEWYLKTR